MRELVGIHSCESASQRTDSQARWIGVLETALVGADIVALNTKARDLCDQHSRIKRCRSARTRKGTKL